jgi:UDP-N-acetyl-D-galactosamine dehydrogenase
LPFADPSREISDADMALAVHAEYTGDPMRLRDADFVLVAVPTPVDKAHLPDFDPVIGASRTIGPHLKPGASSSTNRRAIAGPGGLRRPA